MVCEECLRDELSPFKFVGMEFEYEGHHMEITDLHAEEMQKGLDYLDDIPGKIFIEKRLDLGRWMPGQFGTCDVSIIPRWKPEAVVFDWKWGYLPVSPVDNDQMKIYALGIYDNYIRGRYPNITRFRLVIWQPFAPGGGGEWIIELDDLLDWGDDLRKAAKMTYHKDAKFVPGKSQCTYCPGAKNLVCEAYKKFNMAMLAEELDDMDDQIKHGLPLRISSIMTPERRSHIILHRAMLNKFLDRLEAEALDDAIKARPTPRLKPVVGRNPPRRWFDKAEAEKEIGNILTEEEAYQKKLISPTQFQKLVPERLYERMAEVLVDHGTPKITLVPVEDARPAYSIKDELNDD